MLCHVYLTKQPGGMELLYFRTYGGTMVKFSALSCLSRGLNLVYEGGFVCNKTDLPLAGQKT